MISRNVKSSLSNLKSVQSDFESLAGESPDKMTKEMYSKYARQLNTMINDLESRVKFTSREDQVEYRSRDESEFRSF
jgi:hypothetical protein